MFSSAIQRLALCLTAFAASLLTACSQETTMNTAHSDTPAKPPVVPAGAESIVLAAGCFWCTEAVFQHLPGVLSVTSGYLNGHVKNPTYRQVCGGDTGHAEGLDIVFDPKKITLQELLVKFWKMHDPTTLNRQGGDTGTQYRSGIFYHTEEQKKVAEESKAAAQKLLDVPIVTEITQAAEFYPAEDYHQDYYELNKDRNPYCTMVIQPKLKKLGLPL